MNISAAPHTKKREADGSYRRFLNLVLLGLVLVITVISLNRFYAHDELEHIHASWYISNGYIPYVDFFENHHPLLWICLQPAFWIWGESIALLLAARILMLAFLMASAFLVYRIARVLNFSEDVGRAAAILLLSMVMFVEKAVEVRPDVPQVFFSLLSVLQILLFFRDGKARHLIYSGLSAAAAFLFLQKAFFLLVAYVPVLIFAAKANKIRFLQIVCLACSFVFPVLLFLGLLALLSAFPDYLLTNWIMHIRHLDSFTPLGLIGFSIIQNSLFWILAVWSCSRVFRWLKENSPLGIVTLCGMVSLILVFAVKHPHRQYFLLPLALLAAPAAVQMDGFFQRRRYITGKKISIWAISLAVPAAFLIFLMFSSNRTQMEKIRYVLENSTAQDCIYDGDITYNIYRKDIHYFWYSIKNRGLETYNALTGDRFGGYDACRLIKEKKPRFISDVALDIEDCSLTETYKKTPYKGLFRRREP